MCIRDRSKISSSLTTYAKSADLNKFGGRFKYSKVSTLIDRVDNGITSNITKVIVRRDLKALLNQFAQYELCYGNKFNINPAGYNIKSTGFSVSGVDGTVYIADRVVEGSNIGNLFLFKLTDDIDVEIVSSNVGTVDYKKGEILINTINITSTLLPENIIEIQAVPLSNDVLGIGTEKVKVLNIDSLSSRINSNFLFDVSRFTLPYISE